MGDDIEGAIQHAPQAFLHFIRKVYERKNSFFKVKLISWVLRNKKVQIFRKKAENLHYP
jgi:hypothetical protein